MDGIHGHTLTITTKVVDGEPDEFGQPQYAARKTVLEGCNVQPVAVTDLPLFQDIGLAQLTPEQVIHLKSRYLPFQDQACVNEILRWLAGEYVFDPDCLTD